MIDFTDGYVEVDGARLHYVEAGAGPLVICYHGFPSCWRSFEQQMLGLADGYRVVALDGLGANLSSKPDDVAQYRLSNLCLQLDQFARALVGEECFSLVGHDWGSALAWAFAAAYPERLRSVVGISAPPYNLLLELLANNPVQRQRSSYMWNMRSGKWHQRITENNGHALWEGAHHSLHLAGIIDADTDEYLRSAMAMPGAVDGGINWYRANIPEQDAIDESSCWPELSAQVTVPSLLIWGDDDTTFVPEFIDEMPRFATDLRICRLPGARHWPMMERTREVNGAIRGLLEGTGSQH